MRETFPTGRQQARWYCTFCFSLLLCKTRCFEPAVLPTLLSAFSFLALPCFPPSPPPTFFLSSFFSQPTTFSSRRNRKSIATLIRGGFSFLAAASPNADLKTQVRSVSFLTRIHCFMLIKMLMEGEGKELGLSLFLPCIYSFDGMVYVDKYTPTLRHHVI